VTGTPVNTGSQKSMPNDFFSSFRGSHSERQRRILVSIASDWNASKYRQPEKHAE